MNNLSVEELALRRKQFADFTDEEFRFMLQQVDGRQRTRDKLPTFASMDGWWYPSRISCEQCSSEITARYKAFLIRARANQAFTSLLDLTGGFGVDTYFMSEHAQQTHYIEQNTDLCKIVLHNFHLVNRDIQIHNTTAEAYLQQSPSIDSSNALIFIDPARRSKTGHRVYLIEDCEPNCIALLPTLLKITPNILIKLSPMLDITAALRSLNIPCEVHVVAVQNEVKEVLFFSHRYLRDTETHIYAVNLIPNSNHTNFTTQEFVYTTSEEKQTDSILYSSISSQMIEPGAYIYEPNAAIIKSGAFKLVSKRFGLTKMAHHTHLYLSQQLIQDFPGRVWQIISTQVEDFKEIRANIMTRNYPLSPEQLRKKLKIKDSNTHTIIGARLADKPRLFLCKKI